MLFSKRDLASEVNRDFVKPRDARCSTLGGSSLGVPCRASRLPPGGCGSRCLCTRLSDVARDAKHLHILDGALAAAIAHGEPMVRMPRMASKVRRLEQSGGQRRLRRNRWRELLQ